MNEKYEIICVFNPSAGAEKMDAFMARLDKKLSAIGAKIENVVKQGMRRVQTRMRKFKTVKDGFYMMFTVTGPKTVPAEATALLNVNEDLMKYLITKPRALKLEAKAPEEAVEVNPEMLIGKSE